MKRNLHWAGLFVLVALTLWYVITMLRGLR